MFGVLVPVGPGDVERRRAADVIASVRAHEPAATIVVVDDDLEPRVFDEADETLRTALPKGVYDAYSAMAAGTLTGLRRFAELRADFVVKIDTDALAIAPFASRLEEAFGDPSVGVVGRYRLGPYGGSRDFSHGASGIRRARLPVRAFRRDGRVRVMLAPPRDVQRINGLLRAARRHGYEPGEHCLGGVYAVSGGLLQALAGNGSLDRPCAWTATGAAEDHIVGLLTRAAGYRLADSDIFGAVLQGLAAEPEQLIADGFALVHSIKGADETAVRARFARRASLPS